MEILLNKISSEFLSKIKFYNVVVAALGYKPEGRGFENRWGNWILSIDLILPIAKSLEFTRFLTEISIRERDKDSYGE